MTGVLRLHRVIPASMFLSPARDVTLLPDENSGLAIDFTDGTYFNLATASQLWNQVRQAALDTFSSPYTFYTQSGTSPKMVKVSSTTLGWSPHNMFLNSDAPVTQNVTLVVGLTYTYGITGAGTLTGSAGASGAATAGSPATFTATTTTGTFTVSGGTPTTMQLNRGSALTVYLSTAGAIVQGLPISYGQGLVVEPATTNLVQRSQEFTNAFFSKNRCSVVTGETAPDGTATAFKLIEDSTASATHRIDVASAITITAGVNYTLSFYAKAGSALRKSVRIQWANTPDGIAYGANLIDGSMRATGGGGAGMTFTSRFVENIGNGWFRVSLTASSDTDTSGFCAILMENEANQITYTGDGSSFIRIWGMQLEAQPCATSYVQTPVSATVTRATDIPNVATSAFPYGSTAGTMIVWVNPRVINNAAAVRVYEFSDGTNNESMHIEANTGDAPDSFGFNVLDGGVTQVAPTVTKTGSFNLSGNKVAGAYQANNFGIVVDGGSEVTDVGATVPTMTSLQLGYSTATASREFNGFLQRLIYVPRRMSAAQMQVKTG